MKTDSVRVSRGNLIKQYFDLLAMKDRALLANSRESQKLKDFLIHIYVFLQGIHC